MPIQDKLSQSSLRTTSKVVSAQENTLSSQLKWSSIKRLTCKSGSVCKKCSSIRNRLHGGSRWEVQEADGNYFHSSKHRVRIAFLARAPMDRLGGPLPLCRSHNYTFERPLLQNSCDQRIQSKVSHTSVCPEASANWTLMKKPRSNPFSILRAHKHCKISYRLS